MRTGISIGAHVLIMRKIRKPRLPKKALSSYSAAMGKTKDIPTTPLGSTGPNGEKHSRDRRRVFVVFGRNKTAGKRRMIAVVRMMFEILLH
jgi:hypothetical protein